MKKKGNYENKEIEKKRRTKNENVEMKRIIPTNGNRREPEMAWGKETLL